MIDRLKEKWGIKSNFHLVIIFIVFGITGTISAYLSGPITEFVIGTERQLHWILKLIIRVLILTPIYQILLLIIAFLFGEYKFFVKFVKKFLTYCGLGFLFRN